MVMISNCHRALCCQCPNKNVLLVPMMCFVSFFFLYMDVTLAFHVHTDGVWALSQTSTCMYSVSWLITDLGGPRRSPFFLDRVTLAVLVPSCIRLSGNWPMSGLFKHMHAVIKADQGFCKSGQTLEARKPKFKIRKPDKVLVKGRTASQTSNPQQEARIWRNAIRSQQDRPPWLFVWLLFISDGLY